MDQLLTGLTIVEASRAVAVRYVGRLFAQFGATVVRAPGGDDTAIGYAGRAGEAFGRWLDHRKVAEASQQVDLVIAGLDAQAITAGEALAAGLPGSPSLLALRWFHPDGPWGAWQGADELMHALTGMAYGFGPRPGPPTLAQGHGPQITAGLVGFNAGLAALMSSPRPRRIEANVQEAYMCLTETGAVSALMEGGLAVRLGVNRFVPSFPCSSYRSSDGWIGVTTVTPGQWRGLCDIIGRPQLGPEARYNTTVERLLLADEIDEIIVPLLRTRTTAEWVALGEAARVPITAMPDLAAMPDVAHWADRAAFGPFDVDGVRGPTVPYRATPTGRPVAGFAASGPERPFAGLKVVDFTMGWAGPLCTRYFADLGADVVKIESRDHPDWWRGWELDQSGDPPPYETKFSFISVNRNKRGVLLDLSTPEGRAKARDLVAGSDVLVENFAAGVLEKLGLGPEARAALNPNLIAISMPAFGNDGPPSGIRAYGSTVEQASGLPYANGHEDWPPCIQHVAFGDPIVGLYAAGAAFAALHARDRVGGCEIDLAQVACLHQYAADALIAQQLTEAPLPRTGNRRPRAAPVCVAPTLIDDEWLTVAVTTDAAWRALCAVLERADWADRGLAQRQAEADAIEAAIAAWAADKLACDAAEALQAAGVPAAPVLRVDQLGYDQQLIESGFWPQMVRRYIGEHIIPAAPFAFDGVRPALRRPAPTLGEHTDEVLAELPA
jgi:crotonobetainyl-CoA:carnitine CoA-transferase CaiB-like acyl-CoA transferase